MNSNVAVLTFIVAALAFAPYGVSAHELNPDIIERIIEERPQEKTKQETNVDPRGEERTFASFPEWYIVYSAQEYADFTAKDGRPSQFPYFATTGQYWDSVTYTRAALGTTTLDSNTNTVLRFIGASFSFENTVIGVYERTIGRLTEELNGKHKTSEDQYTDKVAREYGDFLTHTPWYQFPYGQKLVGLWKTYGWSSLTPRGIERRAVFTVGYALKGLYALVMGKLSQASLGTAQLTTSFVSEHVARDALAVMPSIEIVEEFPDGHIAAKAPRYRAFKGTVEQIARAGGSFQEIQGNDQIMVTIVAEAGTTCIRDRKDVIFAMPILSSAAMSRYALRVPVTGLTTVVRELDECGVVFEHVYDY